MIKIFGKERMTLTSDVSTWIVKWVTYKNGISCSIDYPKVRECYKAFTDKTEAQKFAKTLNDAIKLLGIESLPKAEVYEQKVNSLD